MMRRLLPLIVLLLGLAAIGATVAFSFLPEVRAAYPDGEFTAALGQFQSATSLLDLAPVLSSPEAIVAQTAAARFDLYVYLPLYGLFLLAACAMLAQGVRRLEFWAPALLTSAGLAGDAVETLAQLRILADISSAGAALSALQVGAQLKFIGLALGALACGVVAFVKPRRNWPVVVTGAAAPVLLGVDRLLLSSTAGFAIGAGLFWVTLILTAAWRLIRPPTREDGPSLPVPQRALDSLAGARWPLAIGAAGAIAALALHAHHARSVRALPPAAAAITAVAISDDGAFVAVASEDGEIEVWRWGAREPMRIVNADGPARQMLFDTVSQEGGSTRQRLVFSTALGRVRGVDAETGASLLSDDAFPRARTAPLLATASDELFAAGADSSSAPFLVALGAGGARRLDLEVGQSASPTMLRRTLNALSVLLADGQVVLLSKPEDDPADPAANGSDYSVSLQTSSGASEGLSLGVAISDADPGALVLMTGGEAVLERDGQRTSLGECSGEIVESHYVHVFGDGGATATWYFVTSNGFLCIVRESNQQWTLETTQLVTSAITAAVVRSGNIVLGLSTGDVRVMASDGRSAGRLGGHREAVRAIAMTPDGRRAISGAADGTVLTFDVSPSRAPVYARPAAVVAQAREGAMTQWASITNIVGPRVDEITSTADALAGAWARTLADCTTADQALLVRIDDGMVVSSQGSAWTQSSQIQRATEREGALSVRTARGVYALANEQLTISQAATNVSTPLTRCGPSPAWVDWMRATPQRAVADADIDDAAAILGTEADVIRAIAVTETGIDALSARERVQITFLPHLFSRMTNRRFDASNPDVSRPLDDSDFTRGQDDHWRLLREAVALDPDAAISATSWGPFQVLAMNHASLGFAQAAPYVEDVVVRGRSVQALSAFVRSNNLADELVRKDWPGFARGFNGPVEIDRYAASLALAYAIVPIRRDPNAFVESLRGQGARTLSSAQWAAAAQRLGVDAPALQAIATVGSESTGIGPDGLPTIRFQPDAFSALTAGRYDASQPQLSQAEASNADRALTHEQRWALLRQALALDPDAALQATSWGLYRVSGREFEAIGFDSSVAMVRDAAQSEERQLAQFELTVRARGLADELQRRDWPGFARGFYAAAEAPRLARRLPELYASLGGRATAVANVDMSFLDNLVAGSREPLTRADYEAAAAELGCEPEAIMAVVQVESGPLGAYAADGRMVIIFEAHIFSRRTNRVFDESNPNVSYRTWDASRYPRTQAGRWDQLREAYALNPEQALASTVWGKFQIAGFNHAAAGFPSAREFVASMNRSEQDQLRAWVSYIRSNNLTDELVRKDWEGFAAGYNGSGQVERYGRLMREAYTRLRATQ